MTFTNHHERRRYHRVSLNAPIAVELPSGDFMHCECMNFSSDGIDIKPLGEQEHFENHSLSAGTIVHLHIEHLIDAPNLKAAIIKASPTRVGLKFLTEDHPDAVR